MDLNPIAKKLSLLQIDRKVCLLFGVMAFVVAIVDPCFSAVAGLSYLAGDIEPSCGDATCYNDDSGLSGTVDHTVTNTQAGTGRTWFGVSGGTVRSPTYTLSSWSTSKKYILIAVMAFTNSTTETYTHTLTNATALESTSTTDCINSCITGVNGYLSPHKWLIIPFQPNDAGNAPVITLKSTSTTGTAYAYIDYVAVFEYIYIAGTLEEGALGSTNWDEFGNGGSGTPTETVTNGSYTDECNTAGCATTINPWFGVSSDTVAHTTYSMSDMRTSDIYLLKVDIANKTGTSNVQADYAGGYTVLDDSDGGTLGSVTVSGSNNIDKYALFIVKPTSATPSYRVYGSVSAGTAYHYMDYFAIGGSYDVADSGPLKGAVLIISKYLEELKSSRDRWSFFAQIFRFPSERDI